MNTILKKIIYAIIICCIVLFFMNIDSVFFKIGKALYEAKHYTTAEKYLGYALLLKSKNPDYRYYFAENTIQLKPNYRRQQVICDFAYGEIQDSAQHISKEKLREWQANVKKIYGRNYIEQAPLDSRILRWDKNTFPIKVFIDKNGLDVPEYYSSSISSAFNQWDKSIDFLSFETASDKNNAEILIQFKNLPDNACGEKGCRYVVGYTTPTIKGDTLKKMTIVIYDKNPFGKFFSDKEIYNTLLHELGHALGIMGHSYSTEDLMYQNAKDQNSVWAKYRSEFQYINGSDVNTIKLLYALVPDVTNVRAENKDELILPAIVLGSPTDIANKKLKEAQEYIKVSPTIAVGYINLAGAYAELKDYNKAINALNEALNLSPSVDESYVIYYNMASIYATLGHNNTAIKYAELAKNIKSTDEVLELISIIKVRN